MRTDRYLLRKTVTIILTVGLIFTVVGELSAEGTSRAILRYRLEQAVHEHVMEGFRRADLSGEVVAIHLPANLERLDPAATFRPLRTFLPQKAAGRFVIPMEIIQEHGGSVKVHITVECVAIVNGWSAYLPLKRSTLLKPEQFERKKIRVSYREQDYFTSDELPEGYRLSTSLGQGQLLQFHHLETVPAVGRGKQVMIHFRRGSLTLISPGKTRREGGIGEIIPVVATATGKRLYGRLVSPGIVVVE